LARLALWFFFLWRVSRLELRLVPTHPDRAGGLGFFEVVHTEFILWPWQSRQSSPHRWTG
jgi:hypothetical protein